MLEYLPTRRARATVLCSFACKSGLTAISFDLQVTVFIRFSALGAYLTFEPSGWALIRGWALIKFSAFQLKL